MTGASEFLARTLLGDVAWTRTEGWQPHVLVAAADHHGVGPLVWQVLHEHREKPPGLYDALGAARHLDVAHDLVRTAEIARVMAALAASRINALLVKGAALAFSLYPAPWLRPRVDTDLLVPYESLTAADRVLREAGYVPAPGVSTGEFVSHQVPYEYRDPYGLRHVIDLHWKAVNPQVLAETLPFALLWQDAVEVHHGSLHARVPSDAASLLLACVHRLGHHQDNERLVWLYDIHLLAIRLDPHAWRHFAQIARERAIAAVCLDGLQAASRRFGTHIPDAVVATLRETDDNEPSRAYTARRQGRLRVLWVDLHLLPRWTDRLQLLFEHAFPPPSFMMARYPTRHRLLLPILYVHRLVTGARKWLHT